MGTGEHAPFGTFLTSVDFCPTKSLFSEKLERSPLASSRFPPPLIGTLRVDKSTVPV